MRKNMRGQLEGSEKGKTELTAEVSYQEDIPPRYCTGGMMGGLRRNIWRSWNGTGESGKAENSSGGRILKGG